MNPVPPDPQSPSGNGQQGNSVRSTTGESPPRNSEERFRAFVAATSDVIYQMNADWSEMTIFSGEDFIGGTSQPRGDWLTAYIPPAEQSRVRAAICAAIETQGIFELEHRFIKANGSEGWVRSRALPLEVNGGIHAWFGAAADITERKHRERRQAFLLKLSDVLRPLVDPAEIQSVAMALLGEHLGVARAQYFEVEPDGEQLVSCGGYARGAPPLTTRVRMEDFGPSIQETFRTGRPLAVADVSADPRVSEAELAACRALGFRAFICIPLVKHGYFVVGVGIHDTERHDWTDEEIALVEEAAERTWVEVERACAEAELRKSEERYRTLFEAIDEGCALLEAVRDGDSVVDFIYRDVNRAFEPQTGLKDVVGKSLKQVAPNFPPERLAIYQKVLETGKASRAEYHLPDLGRWYRTHLSRVGGVGSPFVAAIFDDITERKRREKDQLFLIDVSDQLVALRDIAGTMQQLGGKIGRHFDATQCVFAELSEDFEIAIASDGWNAEGSPSLNGRYRLADFLSPEQIDACVAGEPTIIHDTQSNPRLIAGSYAALGVRSMIVVPLVRDSEWRFILAILDHKPREWRDGELEIMRELTTRIWTRLERARAEQSLRENEAWLAGLKEAFQAAVSGAPLKWSLDALIRTAIHQMGPEMQCAFYLADPTIDGLHHITGMPDTYAAAVDGFKVGADSISCGLAAHSGRPVITPDVTLDSNWDPWRDLAARHGFRASWSFPIEPASGKVVGTFAMYFASPKEPAPRDMAFVSALTRAAAIIISRHQEAEERARAEEELHRAHDELEHRVSERTRELNDALTRLTLESEERHRLQEERQQLLKRLVTSQEEERARISRELHDNLSQHMVTVKMGLDALQRDISSTGVDSRAQAKESLVELSQRVDELIGIAHRQAWEFRPSELDHLGLEVALQHYASVWEARSGLTVEWRAPDWDDHRLSAAAEIALYRVVQEALTNIARHAQASKVDIELRRGGGVTVSIADNGAGFRAETRGGRLGILGMRERMALLGGTLEIASQIGHGTKVIARLPDGS